MSLRLRFLGQSAFAVDPPLRNQVVKSEGSKKLGSETKATLLRTGLGATKLSTQDEETRHYRRR